MLKHTVKFPGLLIAIPLVILGIYIVASTVFAEGLTHNYHEIEGEVASHTHYTDECHEYDGYGTLCGWTKEYLDGKHHTHPLDFASNEDDVLDAFDHPETLNLWTDIKALTHSYHEVEGEIARHTHHTDECREYDGYGTLCGWTKKHLNGRYHTHPLDFAGNEDDVLDAFDYPKTVNLWSGKDPIRPTQKELPVLPDDCVRNTSKHTDYTGDVYVCKTSCEFLSETNGEIVLGC